jgi:hypothetical protein
MKINKQYIFFLMFFIILFLLFYSNRSIEAFENGWNNQLINELSKYEKQVTAQ